MKDRLTPMGASYFRKLFSCASVLDYRREEYDILHHNGRCRCGAKVQVRGDIPRDEADFTCRSCLIKKSRTNRHRGRFNAR